MPFVRKTAGEVEKALVELLDSLRLPMKRALIKERQECKHLSREVDF